MNKTKAINIFRWIAILPASILGYIVAGLLINFSYQHVIDADYLYNILNGESLGNFYIDGITVLFISEFGKTFAACSVAIHTAPSHNKMIAVAIIGAVTSVTVLLLVFNIFLFKNEPSFKFILIQVISSFAIILSPFAAYFEYKENE